jgi:ATP-binding cassette subfamily G (WHITE) protein 2
LHSHSRPQVGPSGCGKTTFLDLLAGRKTQGQLQGAILYGASKPSRPLLRRYVGYVEQQDTLVDSLTGGLPKF